MGCAVFANGMSIACKVASGKTIAAMPDVCLSPPTPPAGPVPIPYPNTAMASDTTNGSKTVQIGGDEVMLKDQSTFKKSTGDEAATKSLGMGVVSHQIQGEVNFCAWSMDVKFEGQNVPRHLDLTLHNEMCIPANTPTWPYLDGMSASEAEKCAKDKEKEETKCKDFDPHTPGGGSPCPDHNPPLPPSFTSCSGLTADESRLLVDSISLPSLRRTPGCSLTDDEIAELKDRYKSTPQYEQFKQDTSDYYEDLAEQTSEDECLKARRCMLVPKESVGQQPRCCPGQTPHHLIEGASFKGQPGCGAYNYDTAPCVCVEGPNQNTATHGLMHTFQSAAAAKKQASDRTQSFLQANNTAAKAVAKVFPESGCDEDCIKAQVANYHKSKGIDNTTRIKAIETGQTSNEAVAAAEDAVDAKMQRLASMPSPPPGM